MKNLLFFAFSAIILMTAACNKEPGEGGTSTIEGKIWVVDKNNDGEITGEYYGMDEDVYITYGDDQTYSNDFSTSFDGSYRFNYLTPGLYTIFAYSDCDTCDGGMEAVKQTVEITEKKQVIVVPDITVIR